MRDGTNEAPGQSVVVLNAGALGSFVAQGLGPAFQRASGIAVRNESGPSVGLANALRAGSKTADVYMSADAQVNLTLMGAPNGDLVRWHVSFARNAVVLVYSVKSRFVAEFEQARTGAIPWYEVLLQPGLRLVRGDPNQDPLAYYSLFVMELAEWHYGIPGLKRRVLGDDVNPTQHAGMSFSSLDRGEIDTLLMYRSMALEREFPFVELPDEINLGDVTRAESYAQVSFTTNRQQTFRGGPIRFSATVLANAANPDDAAELVAYLLSPDSQRLLADFHFLPSDTLFGGDLLSLPTRLLPFVADSTPR